MPCGLFYVRIYYSPAVSSRAIVNNNQIEALKRS